LQLRPPPGPAGASSGTCDPVGRNTLRSLAERGRVVDRYFPDGRQWAHVNMTRLLSGLGEFGAIGRRRK